MKVLINGVWHSDYTGEYRKFPAPDRASGRSSESDLQAGFDPRDCHLYVSYACPFSHRVILASSLVGLDGVLAQSILDPDWSGPDGWVFSDAPGCTPDAVNGKSRLHEIYTLAQPQFTGKVTVPVLWLKSRHVIVSNESLEILRMLSAGIRDYHKAAVDLCPQKQIAEINYFNVFIDRNISSGFYAVRSAANKENYKQRVEQLFRSLEIIDQHLKGRSYLVGNSLTEADLVLFASMVRFDVVYYELFSCNRRRLAQMPRIAEHTMRLFAMQGIADTVRFDHIIKHYYTIPDFAAENGALLAVVPNESASDRYEMNAGEPE